MEETIDQGQENSQEVEGQDSEEQSETTENVEEAKAEPFYVDPMGREMTPEQLRDEYSKTHSYITKLEQEKLEREARAEATAREALDNNELLENVDPNVKEAIGKIALDTIKQYEQAREAERAQAEKDREWNSRFEAAEKAHDGKDGLPKFAREKVLDFMMKAEIYDPEIAYRELHKEVIQDKLIKEAFKAKGVSVETESTGGDTPRKPEGSTPKSFEEAASRAYERLRSS